MDNSNFQPQKEGDVIEFAKNILLEKADKLASMPVEEINTLIGVLKSTESREFLELERRTKEFCEKYHKLYNLDFLGFVKLTNEGVICEANPTFCNWLGISVKDIINKKFSTYISDPDSQLFESNIKPASIKLQFGLHLKKRDNSLFPVSANMDLLANGKEGPFIILILMAKSKFTGLEKEAQRRFSLKNSQIAALIQNIPFDFFMLDSDGTCTLQNDTSKNNWGDFTGKKLKDVSGVSDKVLSIWFNNNRRAFCGETIKEEVEYEVKGIKKRMLNIISPVVNEGRVCGILGCNIDLTELKTALIKLKEAEEKFKYLADKIPVGIFKTKISGEFVYANTAVAAMFEFSSTGDLMRENIIKRYNNPQDRLVFLNEIKSQGKVSNYEFNMVTRTGKAKHMLGNIIFDGEEISGMFVDITEHKKAEAVLEEDRNSFKKIADESALALLKAQKDLFNAKHLSDIGTLAATIAHELRNPLAAIKLATYNMKHSKLNLGIDKHIANINKKIDESEQIINNLLFYSRIKSPHYQKININEILNECIDQAREQFEKFKPEIHRKFQCLENITIDADPTQIKEMCSNILNNACDAISEKNGTVEVSAEYINGDYIKIYFKDTGMGIDEAHLAKIFEPFFTTKARGTGLGLAVSLHIAHLHHGNIDVLSRQYEGTTLVVTLPINRANGYSNHEPESIRE
ncbi:MAG: ATP-binding protein [Candidatus Omnitrophica bacterium]|nr:ATP-binding protein [Candidatus Omnitrophota bacterium]